MTIKEVESLSGMDRANIRFYEREGLINPERMANGYRNYTEDELQILLRIKLLRSIHISLDEIRDLKAGSRDLADSLEKKISDLGDKKQSISNAQELCSIMVKDRVAFSDLNAKKYLDIARNIDKDRENPFLAFPEDKAPYVFFPWRRFLARGLDLSIYSLIWVVFLISVFNVNILSRGSWENIFDTFVSLGLTLFLEPLWLHILGTTPGKAVFGLRIESLEGRRLLYSEGLDRTWGVIARGMGYGIPIYSLVRLWKSYNLCGENEIQPWDDSVAYTIKDTKKYRGVLFVSSHIALFIILIAAILLQQLPPNRGDLNIDEFTENYRYYAEFYGFESVANYPGNDDESEDVSFDVTPYIQTSYTETPEYDYTIKDGHITSISFAIEIENSEDWLGSYDTQMFLASLAFAGGQKETGLFSDIPKRLSKQIGNAFEFENFHFIESGIEFICDINYSGYFNTGSGLLIPEDDATETYFKLDFSMNKLK